MSWEGMLVVMAKEIDATYLGHQSKPKHQLLPMEVLALVGSMHSEISISRISIVSLLVDYRLVVVVDCAGTHAHSYNRVADSPPGCSSRRFGCIV